MIADPLPEAIDYVFVAGALPEPGLHRVAIAIEGLDATALIAVTLDRALEVCDRLNGMLGQGGVLDRLRRAPPAWRRFGNRPPALIRHRASFSPRFRSLRDAAALSLRAGHPPGCR